MFEVPWVLSAHLKKVQKRRKDPKAEEDDPDWDDEDEYSRNELVDETNWR